MTSSPTIGFPRMMKEPREKRVFLPDFIQYLTHLGATVYIEEGYGSRSGFSFDSFRHGNEAVHMCSRAEAFQQDYVLVLRSPKDTEYPLLRPGNCLISMLHYPTRPKRVALLNNLGIKTISLDSIVNDANLRLVENMKAVAWNGLEAAYDRLEKMWPGLRRPTGRPINVLILGTGMVGKHAVEAATKLGNTERNNDHIRDGGPGAIAQLVGRNITSNAATMESLFQQADMLVDATQRRNPAQAVVPNDWLAWLPEHAVVVDLAVDPYTLDARPPVVRGIEGIPQGNLDQFVFEPDDSNWSATVPASIPTTHRRIVASCYSWPGIHPAACMEHYASQLEPLLEALLRIGYDDLTEQQGYFERALYRATMRAWLKLGQYAPRPR
jgi:alanine dehydrogenase